MAAYLEYVQVLKESFEVFELVLVPENRMPKQTCLQSSPVRARGASR